MTTEQDPGNAGCLAQCPKYALCEKMRLKGLEWLAKGDDRGMSSVEFETDDGRLVSFEEFMGIPTNTEVGTGLRDSGEKLGNLLLQGCQAGEPKDLGGGILICQSEHKRAIDFTAEDIDR